MKLLANTTVQALLLTFVLGFYAWSLGKDVIALKRARASRASVARANLGLAYELPDGIDVYGKHIVTSSPNVKKDIVFLLRNDNLQDDLTFWGSVETLLDSHNEIGLIGYCDNQQCVESIREMHPLAFPVLAFGEATGIQAVVNADVDGKAIVTKVGPFPQSKILWRAPDSSPQTVAWGAIR